MQHRTVVSWNLTIRAHVKQGQGHKALPLFDQMQQEGVMPDKITFISILAACANPAASADGKRIHVHILDRGFEPDNVISTALLSMYGKCGSRENARSMFDKMLERDVIAWTAIITVYAQHGHGQMALQLFYRMQQEGVMPDKITFISILDACATYATLDQCKQIHGHVLNNGNESDVAVGTALVNMYGKCGSLVDALKVFDEMCMRNVFTWSTIIAVHVQNGQGRDGLRLFHEMREQGIMPNQVTFISILAACASEEDLAQGKQMHAVIVDSGFESNIAVGNTLVNMFGKCGTFKDAWRVFEKMPYRDVISWTIMIAVCVRHGKAKKALQLLDQMQLGGNVPDKVTFVSILEACASPSALSEGEQIHALILDSGNESDCIVRNALVNMYGRCGNVEEAQRTFDKMTKRDTVSWNAIIQIHAQQRKGQKVLQIFRQMQEEGEIPDKVTVLSTLSACNDHAELIYGMQLHAQILASRFQSDLIVGTTLTNMYGRCGSLKDAQRTFDELQGRDLVTWNTIIAVHVQHGQGKEALQFFDQMLLEGFIPDQVTFITILSAFARGVDLSEGEQIHARILDSRFKSDVVVGNALLNMYGKCSSIKNAQMTFDIMPQRDLVSWNALIAIYALHARSQEVLQLFEQMRREGFMPDKATWTSILTTCADLIDLPGGTRMHACLLYCGLDSDALVGTALLNMYGKSGNVEIARRMFDSMPKQNLIAWNSMIAIYAQHGQGKEALKLFDQMLLEEVMPDKITFISILAACSHAGLLHAGCHFFGAMIEDYGMSPSVDHYTCMIDLLGRVGRLDEAENLISSMPMQPTVRSFLAILGACRYQVDVKRGEHAAKHMFELDPENAAPYILLSNLYVTAAREDDAANAIQGICEKELRFNASLL